MSTISEYPGFIYKPLTNRMKLGEGGIAVFNITHTYFSTHSIPQSILSGVISFLTLCVLYGYNDYKDRHVDLINPKKDQVFVASIILHPRTFAMVNLILSLSVLLFCLFFLGFTQFLFLLLLLAINIIYSNRWKAVAGLDLFIVIAWGMTFTLVSHTVNFNLSILAGVMTGVAHFFQMLIDLNSDRRSNIETTLVRYTEKTSLVLIVLSIILGSLLMAFTRNPFISLSTALPVVFYYSIRHVAVSWFLSRAYFFGIWIVMLNLVYGLF